MSLGDDIFNFRLLRIFSFLGHLHAHILWPGLDSLFWVDPWPLLLILKRSNGNMIPIYFCLNQYNWILVDSFAIFDSQFGWNLKEKKNTNFYTIHYIFTLGSGGHGVGVQLWSILSYLGIYFILFLLPSAFVCSPNKGKLNNGTQKLLKILCLQNKSKVLIPICFFSH